MTQEEKPPPGGDIIQVDLTVPSQTQYLGLIGKIGEEVARNLAELCENSDHFPNTLNLVLTEAMANVIKHTAAGQSTESVRITIEIEADELLIKVYDSGPGFELEDIPEPDLDHPTEGGLGLFFIRTFMDSVDYSRMESGNLLVMKKKIL